MKQPDLKQQFLLWAAGQALPDPREAKPYLGALRVAIVAAIASGVMVAVGAVGLMYSLYAYLVLEGLNAGTAILLVSAIAFLLSVLGYVFAGRKFTQASYVTQAVELFPQRQVQSGMHSLANLASSAVYSFIDGLQQPPAPTSRSAEAMADAQRQIDECLREIDALERRLEVQMKEDAIQQVEQLAERNLPRH